MYRAIMISRVLVASVAVWRLANLFFESKSYAGRSRFLAAQPESVFGNRLLDCVCWLSVWLSAQTAIWVAGGLSALLLNWLLFSSLYRLFAPASEPTEDSHRLEGIADPRAASPDPDFSSLAPESAMQVNHG